jgi:PIN domain nuclease of toxin-antitoxin system
VLLDTHVCIWLASDERRIGARVRRRLANRDLAISAASVFEIGQLVRLGRFRIEISPDLWIDEVLEAYSLDVLPITALTALQASNFVHSLRDPMDCLIAATAVEHGLELVTADERLQSLPGVRTYW